MIKDDVHLELKDVGERNVRIVLLGWLGSRMRYLNKYSDKWNELNCSTFNVIDTRNVFRQFWTFGRADEVAKIVLKELIKDKSDTRPIILHVFSNGGCLIYNKLVDEIYHYNAVFNYKPIHVAGAIFDSCPSRPRYTTGKKAALLNAGNIIMRCFIHFMYLFFIVPMLVWNYCCSSWYDELVRADTRYPQQFIYSSGDELVKSSEVEEAIAKRKTMNKVYQVNFGSQSGHVNHLRHNEELYMSTIRRFLKFTIGEK